MAARNRNFPVTRSPDEMGKVLADALSLVLPPDYGKGGANVVFLKALHDQQFDITPMNMTKVDPNDTTLVDKFTAWRDDLAQIAKDLGDPDSGKRRVARESLGAIVSDLFA